MLRHLDRSTHLHTAPPRTWPVLGVWAHVLAMALLRLIVRVVRRGVPRDTQEMSHRDPGGPVQDMIAGAEQRVRSLLSVPDNYHVIYMAAGAHLQVGSCAGQRPCGAACATARVGC